MPLKLKKTTAAKRTTGIKLGAGSIRKDGRGLKESSLKVFDIPIGQLVAHTENPNEQSEKTFDQLVERIREEGFDEPIHVYPEMKKGTLTGAYVIFSGHHRVKAGKLAGMTHVPAIIRDGWDEDRVAIELVTRNQLRGNLNAHKFTELFNRLKSRYEPEQLKKMMGLTEKKQFATLYKQIANQLQPKQRQKLEEAKETIKSVDDLSKILNNIFKEHGSETDHSFMVFTYGGKKHYYIQVESDTAKKVEALKARMEAIGPMAGNALFNALLSDTVRIDNVISEISNEGKKATPANSKPRIRLAPKRK
jgi:ParB/RepB/Spo0J family partition protein